MFRSAFPEFLSRALVVCNPRLFYLCCLPQVRAFYCALTDLFVMEDNQANSRGLLYFARSVSYAIPFDAKVKWFRQACAKAVMNHTSLSGRLSAHLPTYSVCMRADLAG